MLKLEFKNSEALLQELQSLDCEIFFVGGCVRDSFLNLKSKDTDILITNILLEELKIILSKYGKIQLVGSSFGILKFKPEGETEDIDVAVPRIERKIGVGYTGFEVETGKHITIKDDLSRRDLTINAIAKNVLTGELVDPFNGAVDLRKKLIKVVSKDSFSEDPLRLLRSAQFFSRFKHFVFDGGTLNQIKSNALLIKEITPERILIELEKIVSKGDIQRGVDALNITGLDVHIFGDKVSLSHEPRLIKTVGEFMFSLLGDKAERFYKDTLKGDLETTNEIKALQDATVLVTEISEARYIGHKLLKTSSKISESLVVSELFQQVFNEFKLGHYPKSLKDLNVNGDDLLKLGLKGKDIGDTLDLFLKLAYSNVKRIYKE